MIFNWRWFRIETIAAVFVFASGLMCLIVNTQSGRKMQLESLDFLQRIAPAPIRSENPASDVVIIYLDEPSHKALNQPFNIPWSRALHAKLLDRLTQDKSKAVVFDIIFSDPGPVPDDDEAFARAMKKNGRVILAADFVDSQPTSNNQLSAFESSLTLPNPLFLASASGWGFCQLQMDEDFAVREHMHGMPNNEAASLSWATAQFLELPVIKKDSRFVERWINYYGHPRIPSISYRMALEMPTNYFQNKVVFIGGKPSTSLLRDRRDEFRSPYTAFSREPIFIPGVAIHATTYLNLANGDWLRRTPPVLEWLLLLVGALFFGSFLTRHTLVSASFLTVGGVVLIGGLAGAVYRFGSFWFPWMIIVAVQAPLGFLLASAAKSLEWYKARREAQARIREQAALLDKARDAIMVFNLDGQIRYWNPGSQSLYGWSTSELQETGSAELLFIGTSSDFSKTLEATLKNGEWAGQLEQTTKTGRKLIVESRWSCISNESGTRFVLVINTDVSEKKKLEAQLWRTQRLESIGTLAGGLAHDLNNFLTPILMSSQVLQANERDEKNKEILQVIELSAKQGAGVAKGVLTFVRGGVEGEMAPLQPRYLIHEIAKLATETFPKSIKMVVQIAPGLLPVKGNASQLHQVLLNLAVNARDAMPQGGTITIEAWNASKTERSRIASLNERSGDFVVIKVSDTGIGIAPEILDRIFDPFFSTKAPGKGTGLGLSTVLGIVKSHQGAVDVTTSPGDGTAFWVFLPASEATASVKAIPLTVDSELLIGRGEAVLVVDSAPLTRGMIEFVLRENNYRVFQTGDMLYAKEILAHHGSEISVAFFDALSLEAFGNEYLVKVQADLPSLRVVIVGGTGEKIGPNVLPKPFAASDLLQVLRNVLRR